MQARFVKMHEHDGVKIGEYFNTLGRFRVFIAETPWLVDPVMGQSVAEVGAKLDNLPKGE